MKEYECSDGNGEQYQTAEQRRENPVRRNGGSFNEPPEFFRFTEPARCPQERFTGGWSCDEP